MYSGGSGTTFDPYLIATTEDFVNIRENLSAHFKQVADLDFSGFGEYEPPENNFTGVYDGGNFSIKNANIKGGLFGTVSGSSALVQNIKLEDSNISSIGDNTGGIAREVVSNAIIQYCRVVKGKIESEHDRAGGIAGFIDRAQVRFCWTDVLIESNGRDTGGIAGRVSGSIIANCYTLGNVVGGNNYVGGIAGYILSDVAHSTIEKCYTAGYVYGLNYVGGICGYMIGYSSYNTTVKDCFALNRGIVRNTSSNENFGRICGGYGNRTVLENNYALENMKFYPAGLDFK